MVNPEEILNFLECPPGAPTVRYLNRLIHAYVRKVPWETVFRIAKRAATAERTQCPRWPAEVWQDAMQSGGGGTCYENNYAFFELLQALGFTGYLTVNDMGAQRGCHAAIILLLKGRKYLVDAGIPIHAALPLDPQRITHRATWLHTYTVRPQGGKRYEIERSRHPMRNIYTLYDIPVPEPDYRKIVEQDYSEAGLFLDRVIVVKVIGERLWRFNSLETPYRIEGFGRHDRQEVAVPPEQIIQKIAGHFQMQAGVVEAAFRALNKET